MKMVNFKKDGDYWQIWGFPLFSGDRRQVLDWVSSRLEFGEFKSKKKMIRRGPWWIATVNPEFVMEAVKDASFKKILCKKTDLNVVDGTGLIWAKALYEKSRITNHNHQLFNYQILRRIGVGVREGVRVVLGKYQGRVVAGSELMIEMCRLAKSKNYRVFFLGGWGDRAERAGRNIQGLLSDDKLGKKLQMAWSPGEPEVKNTEVLGKINKFKPHILLVAYGMKKQEEWIEKNLGRLDVRVVMGVGRSFDYYSGDLKRASKIWRSKGLEWLYSLIKEPRRWRRQLVLPKFVWKVIRGG